MRRNYTVAGLSSSSRKLRLKVITGTDAPAILGVSRWRTAFDVFAEKRGEAEEVVQNEAMSWGNRLEPLIRWRYEELTGRTLRKPEKMLRHPDYPFMGGHVDGIDDEVVFEAKTARFADGWGESGSDIFPVDYRVQLLHYLALTGLRRGELAVLIGGSDFRTYTIEPEPELIDDLIREEKRWWLRHVVGGEPPIFDGSRATTAWLRRVHPKDSGDELVAMPHQYGLLAGVVAAERYYDEAETARELGRQVLMETMGDASRLLAPGLRVSWTTADRKSTDWKGLVEEYERLADQRESGLVDRSPFEKTASIRTIRVTVGSPAETVALGDPSHLPLSGSSESGHTQDATATESKETGS